MTRLASALCCGFSFVLELRAADGAMAMAERIHIAASDLPERGGFEHSLTSVTDPQRTQGFWGICPQ